MIDNVDAVQENHEEVELDQLQPLQRMMDGQDEDMLQIDNQHPPNQQLLNQQDRQQVMSLRERERQQRVQANALQDRPNPFEQANAQVVMQRQQQENRRQQLPGGVFLQQNNILQQVIHSFEQSPQLNMLLENQQDVIQQLVQEAHRVRGEMRDMKGAIGRALTLVDQNQTSQAAAIQELREILARQATEIANVRHLENELQSRFRRRRRRISN